MLKVTGFPFVSGGQAVASSAAEVGRVYAGILAESRTGVIKDYQLLSAAGYRKLLGALPAGVDAGSSDLFLVVRMAKEHFTVMLRQGPGTAYKAVGFFR
jgi:hypothetical protein